jgi:hypothetical protein
MRDVTSRAPAVCRSAYAASLLLVAILVGIGCGSKSPVGPCFDNVAVSVSSGGQQVALGDTVTVSASTYTAYGTRVACSDQIAWVISDSTIAGLEPTPRPDKRIARGLRVGTVTIQATIDGKSGQSPLHVVP